MRFARSAALTMIVLSLSTAAVAQDGLEVDASTVYAKPLTAVGPTLITINHLNIIRYRVQIGRDQAQTDGTSLALLGFPTVPSGEDAGGGSGATSAASAAPAASQPLAQKLESLDSTDATSQSVDADLVGQKFEKLARDLDALAGEINEALAAANTVKKTLDKRLEFVNRLVAVSDNLLRGEDGAETLAARANAEASHITPVLEYQISPARPFYLNIAGLQARVEGLMTEPGFRAWLVGSYPNGRKWEIFRGRLNSLPTSLAPLERDSDLRKQVLSSKSKLALWRDVLEGVSSASFSRTVRVECGYPFWRTREHTVELHTVDRLETDVAKATRKQTVARIVCPSSVLASGGFAVGGVDENEFGFVQTANDDGGVKSTIGRLSSGSETVSGLLLGHFRMGNLTASRKHAWYLSTGTLVSFGDTESRLGYVFGASASITRSMLLTAGVEARRSHTLSGGFELGDDVPEGLTEPPTEKEWKFGAVFGVTIAVR